MKVNRKAGTCNSWQEMDIESRQAVYLAERLVENKRGVVVGKEHIGSCTLEVCYGCNISNTQIDIVDRYGLTVAFTPTVISTIAFQNSVWNYSKQRIIRTE